MKYAKPPRWAAKVAAFFVILTMIFVGSGLVVYWIMNGVPA